MFQKTIILPDDLDGKSWKRSACRWVVIDEDWYVPMVLDSYMWYYKLPGWWMEWDEDKIESFKREIQRFEKLSRKIKIGNKLIIVLFEKLSQNERIILLKKKLKEVLN